VRPGCEGRVNPARRVHGGLLPSGAVGLPGHFGSTMRLSTEGYFCSTEDGFDLPAVTILLAGSIIRA